MIVLGIGDWHVGGEGPMLRTVLGSCVAVCLYDAAARVGGMNHFALPGKAPDGSASGRYGAPALEALLDGVLRNGGKSGRVIAKLFGAGHVLLPHTERETVAEANLFFAEQWLQERGIPIIARQTGGLKPLEVLFQTDTGRVFVREVSSI